LLALDDAAEHIASARRHIAEGELGSVRGQLQRAKQRVGDALMEAELYAVVDLHMTREQWRG
jgi:hypothetical protein